MNVMPDPLPLPPQSPADEKTVLASILVDEEAAVIAFDMLCAEDFYSGANRKIFICTKELFNRSVPIDSTTLIDALKKKGWLEKIGEEPYIAEVYESIGTSAHIEYYAKILIEKSRKRRLIDLFGSLSQEAYSEDSNPVKLFEAAKEGLERIEIGKEGFPKIIWGSDYQAGIPDRKPELIGGILRRSHKLLIGAPSKACKSFLAIRLALAIASGRDWLGFQCTQGNVYLANFEIDEGSYMHRVQAVADALGWKIPPNIAFHHLRGFNVEIETLLPAISRSIKGHDIAAAILDPQYKLLRSNKYQNLSENDSTCMSYLYGEFDRHFARNDASPIIVSHFAKGTASFKDSIDRIAGSGVFARDVDALCTLTALETENAYRMEFALREFKTPEPLSLAWNYPLHETDPMLDAVPLKRPGARQGISTGADDEAVLNAVQQLNGHATQTAVRAALSDQMGMSKNRVLDALQRLTNSGKLTSSRGAKNANFYQPS